MIGVGFGSSLIAAGLFLGKNFIGNSSEKTTLSSSEQSNNKPSNSNDKPPSVTPSKPVDAMLGNWSGSYAINDNISVLEITQQVGDSFIGQIKSGGKKGGRFTLGVTGNIDLSQKKILFRETRIIDRPPGGTWFLGENSGIFSDDLKTITGNGSDSRGNRYAWSLSKS
jgi:hypothetical protein